MIVALLLHVCLGNVCRDVELPFDGSALQCMVTGQAVAAQWAQQHPGWVLRRWRCAAGRPA